MAKGTDETTSLSLPKVGIAIETFTFIFNFISSNTLFIP